MIVCLNESSRLIRARWSARYRDWRWRTIEDLESVEDFEASVDEGCHSTWLKSLFESLAWMTVISNWLLCTRILKSSWMLVDWWVKLREKNQFRRIRSGNSGEGLLPLRLYSSDQYNGTICINTHSSRELSIYLPCDIVILFDKLICIVLVPFAALSVHLFLLAPNKILFLTVSFNSLQFPQNNSIQFKSIQY